MWRPGAATTVVNPFWRHMSPSWRTGSVSVNCPLLFVGIGIGDDLFDSIKSYRPELRGWLRICVINLNRWTRVAEWLTGTQWGNHWGRMREWRLKAKWCCCVVVSWMVFVLMIRWHVLLFFIIICSLPLPVVGRCTAWPSPLMPTGSLGFRTAVSVSMETTVRFIVWTWRSVLTACSAVLLWALRIVQRCVMLGVWWRICVWAWRLGCGRFRVTLVVEWARAIVFDGEFVSRFPEVNLFGGGTFLGIVYNIL